MKCLDQHPALPGAAGRGIFSGEAHPGGRTKRRHVRIEPSLEIADNIFNGEAVRALLDEWLVPAIVDSLIRDLMSSTVEEPR